MKTFEKTIWIYRTTQETALKLMNGIGPFVKKSWEFFVFKKSCDWIIFF